MAGPWPRAPESRFPSEQPFVNTPDLKDIVLDPAETEALNFGAYDLIVRPGSAPRLVIFLAGVGPAGSVPHFEWRGAVRRAQPEEHILFLRDRTQSWFNNPLGWDDLIAFLAAYIARHGIVHTAAIGISMGGFGAAILSAHLPIARVIAISPQTTVDQRQTPDPRFSHFWAAIYQSGEPAWPNLDRARNPETEYLCFYTIDDVYDVEHVRLLAESSSHWRLHAFRGEHNLVGRMKRRGIFGEWFANLLAPTRDPAFLGEAQNHEAVLLAHRALITNDRTVIRATAKRFVDHLGVAHAPVFLYPAVQEVLVERALAAAGAYGAVLAEYPPLMPEDVFLDIHHCLPFLPHGWADRTEDDALWSVGGLHVIRARMPTFRDGRDYGLKVGVSLLVLKDGASQEAVVREGGQVLARAEAATVGLTPLMLEFPVGGPIIDLVIDTPLAMSPLQAGIGVDERLLGLKLHWLLLESRERTTE
jgi:pimeloyl-ACP methyl ester carboxylesterase